MTGEYVAPNREATHSLVRQSDPSKRRNQSETCCSENVGLQNLMVLVSRRNPPKRASGFRTTRMSLPRNRASLRLRVVVRWNPIWVPVRATLVGRLLQNRCRSPVPAPCPVARKTRPTSGSSSLLFGIDIYRLRSTRHRRAACTGSQCSWIFGLNLWDQHRDNS